MILMAIESNRERLERRKKIEEFLRAKELEERERNLSKFYLGELILKDNIEFETNNLIMAPTGSGKSHFIQEELIPKHAKPGDKIYYLVSNTALKDSVCPPSSEARQELTDKGRSLGFFTTGNKEAFGNVDYRIHVMTYSEFGGIITLNDLEAEKSPVIFCDEIHSAQAYREINNDPSLSHAIKYLFNTHSNQVIYYFTATNEHLESLSRKTPGQLMNVSTFDYRDHPKIRKYVSGIEIKYNYLEQIRPHLKDRIKGFNYYGFKALAFTAKIDQMEVMETIFIEEGFRPLLLWSVNNNKEMTPHQLEMREVILNTGLIPSPYNVLIINGGMQEGWDLDDKMVTLAVINSTNQTEIIQSLGRYRGDMTTCVQRINGEIPNTNLVIPEKYMDVILTQEGKEQLCIELNLIDKAGRRRKWRSVSTIIEESGKIIKSEQKVVNGKRQVISIISRPII